MEQEQEEYQNNITTSSQLLKVLQEFDESSALLQDLQLIKQISFCTTDLEKLNQFLQVEIKLQSQLDSESIRKLFSKVYKDYQTFLQFSNWCLKFIQRPRRKSLIRCIMLLSLSIDRVKLKSRQQNFQNPHFQTSKDNDEQIKENFSDSYNSFQIQELNETKNLFLQQQQNEQILLIIIDKQNLYDYQMFIWRKLLFKINPQNVENALQVANIYYFEKDYQQTLNVLLSIQFDNPLQAEADLLRGLTYRQLKQTKKAQIYMKQALKNTKNRHPEPQKCQFQIAELCYQLHRYAEAAYFYEKCIEKNICNLELRYKQLHAMYYANLYEGILQLIHQILYIDSKNFGLRLEHKGMLLIFQARVMESMQKQNEFRKEINALYDQALNLLRRPGEEKNSLKNQGNQVVKFYRTKYIFNKGEYIQAKHQFQNCMKYKGYFFQVFIYLALCIIAIQPFNLVEFASCVNKIQQYLKNALQQYNPNMIAELNKLLRAIQKKQIINYSLIEKIEKPGQKWDQNLIGLRRFHIFINQKIEKIKDWTERKASKLIQQLLLSYIFFHKLRMYDIGLRVLDVAKELDEEKEILYRLSGYCCLILQNYKRAEKQYRTAIKKGSQSLQTLKGMFVVLQRKEKLQIFDIGKKILNKYKQLAEQNLKKEKDQKQECLYKLKLGKLSIKYQKYQQAAVYLSGSLKHCLVGLQYYLTGLKLYLSYNKIYEGRALLEKLQKYHQRKDVCFRDLVTIFVLFGDIPRLMKYLKNEEFQKQGEKELELIVRAIVKLTTCNNEQIEEKSSQIMGYLVRLRSEVEQQMTVFRVSAIAYRTAEILYEKKAYSEASNFYSEIPVALHKQISQKVASCAKQAINPDTVGSIKVIKEKLQVSQSKAEEKQCSLSDKKIDQKLLKLLQIQLEKYEEDKKNVLLEQLLKDNKTAPFKKVHTLQKFFELQIQKKGYQQAEKTVRNLMVPLVLFLFYLSFEKEDGLLKTLGVALRQMAINSSSKLIVVTFKQNIIKKAKSFTKAILNTIEQFNKTKEKDSLIDSVDTFEKAEKYIQEKRKEMEKNN